MTAQPSAGVEGLIRVLVTDGTTNVALLKVACPTHAREVVERSPARYRFRLSPISCTETRCNYCLEAHERIRVADWPLE